MAVIAEYAQTPDVTDLVNFDSFPNEDPRIVRLVEILRQRGVAVRFVDDDYVDYADLQMLRKLDLVKLAESRYK